MQKQIFKSDGWEQTSLGLFAEKEANENDLSWYLETNNISDNSSCRWLSYLDFKYWLCSNFEQFVDKEIETDVWEVEKDKKKLQISLSWRKEDEIRKQYVSVRFSKNYGDYYGWSCPCDTLSEVKQRIIQGLKDIDER